jgi:PhnB protein
MPELTLSEQLDNAISVILAGVEMAAPTDETLSGLIGIAGRLRDMPDEGFKNWLGRELAEFEGKRPMTGASQAAISEFAAIHTITPFICSPEGGRLIDFIKDTFDAEETNRHPHHGPDGFVAGVRIGDSDLIIMGGESFRGQECPAALHVFVKDCDAAYQRALQAGAVTLGGAVGEPADRPYGERSAFVSDPYGNYWFIATRTGLNYADRGLGRVTPTLLPASSPPLVAFLKRAFGARVEGHHEEEGRLVHAFVHIGDAVVEMAEAQEQLRPFGFYMHTSDVDAVYRSAIAAGAVSIVPPADQPFGDRLAIVQDPAGNRWFAAKRIERRNPEQ